MTHEKKEREADVIPRSTDTKSVRGRARLQKRRTPCPGAYTVVTS